MCVYSRITEKEAINVGGQGRAHGRGWSEEREREKLCDYISGSK